jgi:hypothetical protein
LNARDELVAYCLQRSHETLTLRPGQGIEHARIDEHGHRLGGAHLVPALGRHVQPPRARLSDGPRRRCKSFLRARRRTTSAIVVRSMPVSLEIAA